MLSEAIDKGMKVLERLTHRLGEGRGVASPTYKKAKLARQSITLDVPSITNLMPYESTDEDLMFINKQSMGFGFKILPMSGADETLVKALSNLLKNRLPVDVDCTVMLYRHHRIKERLDDGFEALKAQGGIFESLASLSQSYHAKAATDGYPNGRNIAAKLSDYEAYLFFSKRGFEKDFLITLRTEIESELNVAGFCYGRLQRLEFLKLMRMLVVPNLHSIEKPKIDDLDLPLSHLVSEGNSLYTIHDAGIEVDGSDQDGLPFKTRIINCEINKWGESLALWQTPDIYANMLEPQHGIPCSFLISMTVRGVSQERMLQKAKMRAKSLNANANAI